MNYLKRLKNKKIAVLGLGYLGSNIYNFLDQRQKELHFKIVPISRENLEIVETETFDYFINCAGTSGDFRNDILGTIDSNVCLTTYLMKNLKIRKKYLMLSSTRVYGFSKNQNIKFNEDDYSCSDHLKLDFIYDGSKKLAESILMNYAEYLRYNVSIVRLSNVYGRFNILDDATLIKKIIKYVKDKKKIEVSENRKSGKDYIYIDDVIDGILRCLIISRGNNIFNIASGKSSSLEDIEKILNIKIKYSNEREKKFSQISIIKAKKEIDFKPIINLEKGLKKIIYQEE